MRARLVCRGDAMIMLKSVGVEPLPNYKRQPQARWDAYLHVPDPDALAAEFASRHIEFSEPLKDTHDGLRGFELVRMDEPWVLSSIERWPDKQPADLGMVYVHIGGDNNEAITVTISLEENEYRVREIAWGRP